MKVSVGNILEEVTSSVIIQQVNAQGVMGSGIAKSIRDKWPVVFDDYEKAIKFRHAKNTSELLGMVICTQVEPTLVVMNVVGQQFYRKPGDTEGFRYTSYDALDKAFTEVARLLQGLPVPIHFPLIGSDRGGAHWPIVKAIIEHRLAAFDLNLWLLPGVSEPT